MKQVLKKNNHNKLKIIYHKKSATNKRSISKKKRVSNKRKRSNKKNYEQILKKKKKVKTNRKNKRKIKKKKTKNLIKKQKGGTTPNSTTGSRPGEPDFKKKIGLFLKTGLPTTDFLEIVKQKRYINLFNERLNLFAKTHSNEIDFQSFKKKFQLHFTPFKIAQTELQKEHFYEVFLNRISKYPDAELVNVPIQTLINPEQVLTEEYKKKVFNFINLLLQSFLKPRPETEENFKQKISEQTLQQEINKCINIKHTFQANLIPLISPMKGNFPFTIIASQSPGIKLSGLSSPPTRRTLRPLQIQDAKSRLFNFWYMVLTKKIDFILNLLNKTDKIYQESKSELKDTRYIPNDDEELLLESNGILIAVEVETHLIDKETFDTRRLNLPDFIIKKGNNQSTEDTSEKYKEIVVIITKYPTETTCDVYVKHKVTILIYDTWPDHDAIKEEEVATFKTLYKEKIKEKIKGTILIHCSAGVGRTGTVIILFCIFNLFNNLYEHFKKFYSLISSSGSSGSNEPNVPKAPVPLMTNEEFTQFRGGFRKLLELYISCLIIKLRLSRSEWMIQSDVQIRLIYEYFNIQIEEFFTAFKFKS